MIETLLMIIAIELLALIALLSCQTLKEENKGTGEPTYKPEALKVQLSKEDKAQARALDKYDGGLRK